MSSTISPTLPCRMFAFRSSPDSRSWKYRWLYSRLRWSVTTSASRRARMRALSMASAALPADDGREGAVGRLLRQEQLGDLGQQDVRGDLAASPRAGGSGREQRKLSRIPRGALGHAHAGYPVLGVRNRPCWSTIIRSGRLRE